MKTTAKTELPETPVQTSTIKLVIIRKSKITDYIKRIREIIFIPEILYAYCYKQAMSIIRDNAHQVFHVVTPDFYFDSDKKANEFAKEVKNINPKSKIFCYSKDKPKNAKNLIWVKTNYVSSEEEIQMLIDLLK